MIKSRIILRQMKSISGRYFRGNQTTHLCSIIFFNLAVYGVIWKNTVEPNRPQMTAWRMPTACKINKAANTHTVCNTHCFSTVTMVARTRLIVMLYVHTLPVFFSVYWSSFYFPFPYFISPFSLSTCLFFSLPYFYSFFPLILLCFVPLFVCVWVYY
jgi:hypothetical protein